MTEGSYIDVGLNVFCLAMAGIELQENGRLPALTSDGFNVRN